MRVGIFGGAFDPIHLGHLVLAERCRDEAKLDEVWFLPSYKPPHKSERQMSRFDQRCEMVTLATSGQPAFRVEMIERELPPPSYTLSTVQALKEKYPECEFAMILGADSLGDLPTWFHPQELIPLIEWLVVPRPGVEFINADRLAVTLGLKREQVRLQPVPCPLIEIASRDLRRRVQEGQSIRYLVPRAVEEYIRDKGLYSQ